MLNFRPDENRDIPVRYQNERIVRFLAMRGDGAGLARRKTGCHPDPNRHLGSELDEEVKRLLLDFGFDFQPTT